MTTDEVIAALNQFVPSAVDRENMDRLYRIFERFDENLDRRRAIPAMFALLERYPVTGFGTPGPLVHELEALAGYEIDLRQSVMRQPSLLTLWMVNRVLNAEDDEVRRLPWLDLLESTASNNATPERVCEEARNFIEYQQSRDGRR